MESVRFLFDILPLARFSTLGYCFAKEGYEFAYAVEAIVILARTIPGGSDGVTAGDDKRVRTFHGGSVGSC